MEQTQKTIESALQKEKLLFDGAFGTYYAQLYDTKELPELANREHPERVKRIHAEYIAAGAQIIRTNTFAANTEALRLPWEDVADYLRRGFRLAKETAPAGVWVAADVGQIPCDRLGERERLSEEYVRICRTFLDEGAEIIVFETFSDIEEILDAINLIGNRAFVIVQFSVNQFGYSASGLSARKLISRAEELDFVDAVGFNCGVGPAHMQQILRGISFSGKKWLTALPNAGYPQTVSNRMIFDSRNCEYFASKVCDLAADGADIVGGCCGTTPEYMRGIKGKLTVAQPPRSVSVTEYKQEHRQKSDPAFFAGKEGRKLIAVELAPPLGSNDEQLMDAAHLLKRIGVDVLTFPDSPSGRTRADSILVAEKVARETGICVMPHICCRDKNAIAMRSQLLGAYLNQIRNFLVVTGDPVPSMMRGSVKSVFNFESVGLMQIISDLNEDQFADAPICYGGAINQGRRNLEVEIGRVKKKMDAGAKFFLTQPVTGKESAERLRRIKEETGARILCGIMPFVSLKNALFMKNEISGVDVGEDILLRYREDMTREEGEQVGVALAKEMMALTEDFADGYYFSFPFNRVHMLEKILQ